MLLHRDFLPQEIYTPLWRRTFQTLAEMGYSIIAYPSTLFIPMIEGMKKGLEKIHSQQFQGDKKILSVTDMVEMLNLDRWIKIDQDIK